ncbi:MAG TPA: GNAT family N-acetyltransferase [Anaerolineales bacterium]|nr:GNAT family N-acetyltransferase [Anaerolineales bacterium]
MISTTLNARFASVEDCSMLAAWNYQLIRDEGHRNPMDVWELEERMRGWLASGEYQAILFEENEPVAYALFKETDDEIYLRQFFVVRHRRHQGIGSCAMAQLFALWPKEKRWTVSVLTKNIPAVAFWQLQGYADYSLTLEILPGTNAPQRSLP